MVSLYGQLAFLLIGLVIGVIVRVAVPDPRPGGWGASLIFGVLGAFLGGYTGHSFGMYHLARTPTAAVMAVVFAFTLVLCYEMFRRTRVVQ